ncbi:MAG TPA: hypothetical protein VLA19_15120 [Herpetosiphonaceae bacterium]|nr:hypothetical protein [Herpetosiphonaceae bacterium]
MKTIGLAGGLGPQATMDFEARVHRVAQELVPQHGNEGYPPMVVVYFREPPVSLPSTATFSPTDPAFPGGPPPANPHLLDAAWGLGVLVDFLVISSTAVRDRAQTPRTDFSHGTVMFDVFGEDTQARRSINAPTSELLSKGTLRRVS